MRTRKQKANTVPVAGGKGQHAVRQKREITEQRLELESFAAWRMNHAALRQWLVERIAERAIEIWRSQRRHR